MKAAKNFKTPYLDISEFENTEASIALDFQLGAYAGTTFSDKKSTLIK